MPARARTLGPRPPLLALLALLAAVGASSGCRGRIRNDPETRAAAGLGVDLELPQLSERLAGSGRLVLRLMPEGRGEAAEAYLYWSREPGGTVRFLPKADRTPADLALFEELLPDRYRLSSFALSARYEREGEPPILVSLAGSLERGAAVAIGAGQLVDLGRLALAISPDRSFRFVQRAEPQVERLEAAQGARADLARLRASSDLAAPAAAGALPPAEARER